MTATRTKTAYYDRSALDETFGDDRVDRYWDETEGLGALHKVGDRYMHRDHTGEVREASEDVVRRFTDGEDASSDGSDI